MSATVLRLTESQLREIVLETSVAYATTLERASVQVAEWERARALERVLTRLCQMDLFSPAPASASAE